MVILKYSETLPETLCYIYWTLFSAYYLCYIHIDKTSSHIYWTLFSAHCLCYIHIDKTSSACGPTRTTRTWKCRLKIQLKHTLVHCSKNIMKRNKIKLRFLVPFFMKKNYNNNYKCKNKKKKSSAERAW